MAVYRHGNRIGWIVVLCTASACAQDELQRHRFGVLPSANQGAVGEVRWYEKRDNWVAGVGNYVGLKAPLALAANKVWELPAVDGSAGQCFQTNGSGVLAFGHCWPGHEYTWPATDGSAGQCIQTNGSKGLSFAACGSSSFDGELGADLHLNRDAITDVREIQWRVKDGGSYVPNVNGVWIAGTTPSSGVADWRLYTYILGQGYVDVLRAKADGTGLMAKSLEPHVHDASDIGASSKLWHYGHFNYLRARHVEFGDNDGNPTAWSVRSYATAVTSSWEVQDNAGTTKLKIGSVFMGLPEQYVMHQGNLYPSIDNSFDVGVDGKVYRAARAYRVHTNELSPVGSNLFITPTLNEQYTFGDTGARWKKMYVKDIDISGTCTGTGCGGAGAFVTLTTDQDITGQKVFHGTTSFDSASADNYKILGSTIINNTQQITTHTTGVTPFHSMSADGSFNLIYAAYTSTAPDYRAALIVRRSRGSRASMSAVQSGDRTGTLAFQGHNGSDFASVARVEGWIEGVSGTVMAGQLRLDTQDTTGNTATRWVITATGHMLPWSHATYDIGNASTRVRQFWVDDIGSYGTASFVNLGASGTSTFNNIVINGTCTGTGCPGGGGSGIVAVNGTSPIVTTGTTTIAVSCPTCLTTDGVQTVTGQKTFQSAILAWSNGGQDIGTVSTRFANVYSNYTYTRYLGIHDPVYNNGFLLTVVSSPITNNDRMMITSTYGTTVMEFREMYFGSVDPAIIVARTIRPTTTGISLGSLSAYFNATYSQTTRSMYLGSLNSNIIVPPIGETNVWLGTSAYPWAYVYAQRVASTVYFMHNGLAGQTQTITIRDAGGLADCYITVSGGIIVSSTC